MRLHTLALLLLLLAALPASANVIIATKTIPNGAIETPYSATILARNGCTPYMWNISSGTLPAGVTYSVNTSTTSIIIAGTPTTAATYNFSVSVTGCGKHTSTVSYSVVIQPAATHIVDLSWNASTSRDVAGYNVYRNSGGAWGIVNVGLVAGTVYTDSTVLNGATYNYATTVVDISGNESVMSNLVQVAVP